MPLPSQFARHQNGTQQRQVNKAYLRGERDTSYNQSPELTYHDNNGGGSYPFTPVLDLGYWEPPHNTGDHSRMVWGQQGFLGIHVGS